MRHRGSRPSTEGTPELQARARRLPVPGRQARLLHTPRDWLREQGIVASSDDQPIEVPEVLELLNSIASLKDGTTALHVVRMAHISACIGERHGLGVREIDLLLSAAPLHDIGKIAVPDAILKKPGPLTPDEMTVMKRHTQVGHALLASSPAPVLQLGAEIALNHHEWWNGSGYPRGVAGEDIPLSARLVAVADVFDALTSERPYKQAWTVEAAVDAIRRESGTHFDPDVVDCLLACLDPVRAILGTFAAGAVTVP